MATKLSRMKIREISLVDAPASPGAHVLLTKRRAPESWTPEEAVSFLKFDPNQPRDEHGRWSGAGIKASVTEAAQRVWERAKQGLATARNYTVGLRPRPQRVAPVKGGGIHFEVHVDDPKGGRLITHLQLRPEHVGDDGFLSRALDQVHRVLTAYSVQPTEPIANGFFAGRYEPNANRPSLFANSQQASTKPAFDGVSAQQQRTTPIAATVTQDDRNKAAQWQEHPTNSLPMNAVRGVKVQVGDGDDARNATLPLNHPTIDYSNSNGHSYFTRDGDYVPGGPSAAQAFIHQNSADGALAKLPIATPKTSGGQGYKMAPGGPVIPPGNFDQQSGIERLSRNGPLLEQALTDKANVANSAAHAAAAAIAARDTGLTPIPNGMQVTRIASAPRPDSSLFWQEGISKASSLFGESPRLFDDAPRLFNPTFSKKAPSLFAKSESEARDARGRWTAGAGFQGAKKAGRALLRTARDVAAPHNIASAAVGYGMSHAGMSEGDISVAQEHASTLVQHYVSQIAAHPLVRGAINNLLRKSPLLFKKGRIALYDERSAVLKRRIAQAAVTFDKRLAQNPALLTKVCRGVFDQLSRELRAA